MTATLAESLEMEDMDEATSEAVVDLTVIGGRSPLDDVVFSDVYA